VETQGPKTGEGAPEAGTVNNVVPLPKDWLGPRDQLVPFGRRAYEKSEASASTADVHETGTANVHETGTANVHETGTADVHEISLTPPPGPDAFWGEDSAEIHAVLQGPVVRDGDKRAQDGDRPRTQKIRSRRRPRPGRAIKLARSRGALAAAALLAAMAALTVAVFGLGRPSSRPPHVLTNPVAKSASSQDVRLASLQKYLAGRSARDAHKRRKARQRPAAASPQHRHAHKSGPPKPVRHVSSVPSSSVSIHPATTSASPVHSAPSPADSSLNRSPAVDVTSSSSSEGVVGPARPASSSETTSSGATSSRSSGQSSKPQAPAGPTGNSAILGPGHCNC
jgi:hypothetical protein